MRKHYLLSGYARCAVCGGSMMAVSRKSTTGRLFRYTCANHWNRGAGVCPNGRQVIMETADAAVRAVLAESVLRPTVIERALSKAVALIRGDSRPQSRTVRRSALQRELRAVEKALQNLVLSVQRGGAVPAILDALNQKESERQILERELASLSGDGSPTASLESLLSELRTLLEDWHQLLTSNASEARPLLQTALEDRIVCRPTDRADGTPMYRLEIPIAFDRILERLVPGLQVRVASPSGSAPFPPVDHRLLIRAA